MVATTIPLLWLLLLRSAGVGAIKIPGWRGRGHHDKDAMQQADSSSHSGGDNSIGNGVDGSTTAPEQATTDSDSTGAAGVRPNTDDTPPPPPPPPAPPVEEEGGGGLFPPAPPPISAILDDMMDDVLRYLRSATATTNGDDYLNTEPTTTQRPRPTAPTTSSSAGGSGILATAESRLDDVVKRLTRCFVLLYGTTKQVVLYKPPVGIVTVLAFYQVARRFVRRGDAGTKTTDIAYEQQEGRSRRQDNTVPRGRPSQLDKDDVSYAQYGGIERTRQQLCLAILKGYQEEGYHGTSSSSARDDEQQIQRNAVDVAVRALSCSYVDSRVRFVQDIIPEVVLLTQLTGGSGLSNNIKAATTTKKKQQVPTSIRTTMSQMKANYMTPPRVEEGGGGGGGGDQPSHAEKMRFMRFTARTVEVRTFDALVRMCRDRLLRTTFRLYRTERYWRLRLRLAQRATPRMFQHRPLLRARLEGDRVRLAYAQAAYENELARLGKVSSILSRRPEELPDAYLLDAVQQTTNLETANKKHGPSRKTPRGRVSQFLGQIPKLALRFDGKGLVSLRSYVGSSALGGQGAYDVLCATNATATNQKWLDATSQWLTEGRDALSDVIDETYQKSTQTTHGTQQRIEKLQQNDGDDDWATLFMLVRDIHRWRRLGEGTTLRLKDNLLQWLSQWDLFGLPSACVSIWIASLLHDFMLPKWGKMRQIVIEAATLLIEIIKVRFYVPIRDLFQEIFNHSPSTQLSDFDIADEERSLDIMLKGLKYGDGTQATRKQALHAALQQYEEDMTRNLLGSAVGGRLMKLILIQVQQLKVGLLDALESIEVLLNANKLNVQLLAIIPSVVITTVVARLAVQALFNFRTKDIRPLPVVYSEMTEYLNAMEELILVSSDEEQDASSSSKKAAAANPSKGTTTAKVLDSRHLGEFVFYMHHYLVLLDYASPPFPIVQCDNIHRSLQEVLGPCGTLNRVPVSRQLALLGHIKVKHRDLEKYL